MRGCRPATSPELRPGALRWWKSPFRCDPGCHTRGVNWEYQRKKGGWVAGLDGDRRSGVACMALHERHGTPGGGAPGRPVAQLGAAPANQGNDASRPASR